MDFARVAVLIAARQGKDEPPIDDALKAKLRSQAFEWLKAELPVTVDRAGKTRIIAAAAPLPELLDKLVESASDDGLFQAELARHYSEQGNHLGTSRAREARALLKSKWGRKRRTSPWQWNWPTCS